jgi:nucleoside-diphosphate-sugar epimerase
MSNLLARDLDLVLTQTRGLWDDLRGARVLITGGTGFFGCWLLESLLWADARFELNASVAVLTRNAGAFSLKAPHLAKHRAVTLHEGDVRTFGWDGGRLSHVVHAGTDTVRPQSRDDRLRVFDTIVEGTRRALDVAERAGASRFIMTSTGAVYGRQPAEVSHLTEEHPGSPDPTAPQQAGAEAKRAAEMLCAIYAGGPLHTTIARCFAFVGPYLPLDTHLAVGNFIAAALDGAPIRIAGDGTPVRSYMYAADLAAWLWTILLRGERGRAYNVGSEDPISIAETARAVAEAAGGPVDVLIARTPTAQQPAERYVPSTQRARGELGVRMTVDFHDALARTFEWHRARAAVSRQAGHASH